MFQTLIESIGVNLGPIGLLIIFVWAVTRQWSGSDEKPAALADGLETMRNKQLYLSRLKEGHSKGFVLFLLIEPSHASDHREEAGRARELFEEKFLPFDPVWNVFPDAHIGDYESSYRGLVLLIGHPIPQSHEHQLELVRSYIRGWVACVEVATERRIPAVASIAYGGISYFNPRLYVNPGSCSGLAYNAAVVTLKDTARADSWPATGKNRIAVNAEAAALLLKELPGEVHHGYDGLPQL
jgi:hypothetical protein